MSYPPASCAGFVGSERGAAPIRSVMVLAAVLGLSVVTISVGFGPAPEATQEVSLTPIDSAHQALMAGKIRSLDAMQTRLRLEQHADPAARTPAQLRNAHRSWARRVADGSYPDPELAADMLAITTQALRLRGLDPHPDA